MKKILPALALLLALAECLKAQPANTNISQENTYNGEPYIAVNPSNPQNMIVAWMGLALDGIPRVCIKTETTFDGGATWGNLVIHPHGGPTLHSADVSMAFRNDGALFMSYIDYSEYPDTGFIFIQQSIDGGLTWSNPVQVWNANEDAAKQPIDRPWLVIDNSLTANAGTLYLTTKPAPWIAPPNRPYLKVSSDSGQTWSAYRYVDSTGYLVGNIIAAPMGAPAVSADGALCIAYPSYLSSQSIFPQIFLAKSYNRGAGFDYINMYTGILYPVDTNYKAGYHLATDPDNANRLCFAYVNNLHGDADIFTTTSNDGGNTWGSWVRVNDDSIGNGVGQDMVWAQYALNGDLLLTWRDRRNALAGTGFYQPSDFYAAVSHNNGASYSKNIRLSNVTAAFDSVLSQPGNDFMSCFLLNDTINAVWGDVRSGKLNIYFVKTSDSTALGTGVITIAQEDADALVYPVPAQNYFAVMLPGLHQTFSLELLDNEGKVLLKKGGVSSNEKIDCSAFSSGTYFLKIYEGNNVSLKKILITSSRPSPKERE